MGRGKPFKQSLNRLIAAGVLTKPAWMSSVEATKPSFEAVSVTKPAKIEYPEDRLRTVFLQRNPETRRIPVNLKAATIEERHIADKFVSIQMELMQQHALSEEEAYNRAGAMLTADHHADETQDLSGPLANPSVSDEATRLYLASWKDSQRDIALHRSLVKHNL